MSVSVALSLGYPKVTWLLLSVLRSSPDLALVCDLADLDPSALCNYAEDVITNGRRRRLNQNVSVSNGFGLSFINCQSKSYRPSDGQSVGNLTEKYSPMAVSKLGGGPPMPLSDSPGADGEKAHV